MSRKSGTFPSRHEGKKPLSNAQAVTKVVQETLSVPAANEPGAPSGYQVRRLREEDWESFRDLRMEMLQDTPIAYTETYESALDLPEAEWRFRARRGASESCCALIAFDESAPTIFLATMTVFEDSSGSFQVVGVYASPSTRGSGLAKLMLGRLVDWARNRGAGGQLSLLVHEKNSRAFNFYLKAGFAPSGQASPYTLDPAFCELEMVLKL
ncbi:GNAT family N-acetyltransferase [Leifsonia aquatica]|uniref:GNAT family N-acetyltransferase n=1 Tax=Leifsonia aquatica TaxID=144185 RepID=UPI003813B9BB